MSDLKSYLTSKRKQVDDALNEILETCQSRIAVAMKYSLMAGGKRIRPILCMAAAEAVGGKAEDALPAACAIEMIHTYSLIHDDLPAMDNDELRRGKPTCHIEFDEATAILAGDALLTLAFEVLSSAGTDIQAERRLRVIQMFARAAGYRGMIEGQMRDIASEGILLNAEELRDMHACKTGAIISASVEAGAVLGNGNDEQICRLKQYADHIGLAFQVADDILNIVGDPAVMGKAAGTDNSRKKNTYPSVMGLEASESFAEKLIRDALQALEIFDSKSDPLRAVATYIIKRKR